MESKVKKLRIVPNHALIRHREKSWARFKNLLDAYLWIANNGLDNGKERAALACIKRWLERMLDERTLKSLFLDPTQFESNERSQPDHKTPKDAPTA